MKKFEDIFKNTETLSIEEIKKYFSDKISAEEKHRIEKKLNADSFLAEAMEGFEQNPKILETTFNYQQAKSFGNIYKLLFFATSISASIIIFYFLSIDKVQKVTINNTIKENTYIEQPLIISDSIIEKTIEPEPKEQINYKQTIRNRPKTIVAKTATKKIASVNAEELQNTDITNIPKKNVYLSIEVNPAISKSNVKFTYIHDLKVIDYANIYTEDIPINKFAQLTGTPANLSNKNEELKNEHELNTVYIPYEEFLSDALLDFKDGNYKAFLKNAAAILKHYPDDLNAFFYGGLSFYNLNRCDNAIQYFDKCINAAYNTFYQEAMWYKALSMLKCKKEIQAEIILKDIISQKGFYAEQAQIKIYELKK